ncbi:MAG TPA: hypothetical protein VM925_17890, partial [Labilithrix sp.]|nr:hypothetical protein [Labilithrix sp.]
FQSPAEFQKSITTESKMFSIYAVGIKKGYRRETRVKIHTVIDFRNAPALGQSPIPGMPNTGLPGTMPTNPLNPTATATQGAGTDAIAAANMPSTGGQVLYYRVE